MNKAFLIAWIVSGAVFVVVLLRRLVLQVSARRQIRQTLQATGVTIERIRPFRGFLDLGSMVEAWTSEGYLVDVTAPDGGASEVFCLVRHLPLLGLARAVEIWNSKPRGDGRASLS